MVNTAINVIGRQSIDRRLTRLNQALDRGPASTARAIRALLEEVLRRVPVITGRLYRSLRLTFSRNRILITFRAPYAYYPHVRSRRNRRYLDRGLRIGIRRANAVLRSQGTGLMLRMRGTARRIRGAQLQATVSIIQR